MKVAGFVTLNDDYATHDGRISALHRLFTVVIYTLVKYNTLYR